MLAWQQSTTIVPPRPAFPPGDDERTLHSLVRESILEDDWDDTAEEWRAVFLDKMVARTFGPPDTSRNSLMDACRQLSVPGLYGTPPKVQHTATGDQTVAGLLTDAGWSTKMQEIQFKALGMGDYILRPDMLGSGDSARLILRPISPAWCWVRVSPDEPDRPLGFWELRLRWHVNPANPETGEWVWAWDVVDIGWDEFAQIEQPSYRVLTENPNKEDGEPPWLDISEEYLIFPDGKPRPPQVGTEYPYLHPEKGPVLNFVIYRAHDTGRTWNHYVMRGAHRATLNESLYWSYTGKAALGASGRAVIALGVAPPATNTLATADNDTIRSIALMPGSMLFAQPTEDSKSPPSIHEVGPGADLGALVQFCNAYGMQQLVRWGLNPADVTRANNTPTSGAALYISAKGKREFSDRVRPLFQRRDIELIELVALLATIVGKAAPLDGYTVEHVRIPLSPAERNDQREDIDWQIERGYLSEVDAYMQEHPGVTEAQALDALVAVALMQARAEQAIAEALTAAGVKPPSTPPLEIDPEQEQPDAELPTL